MAKKTKPPKVSKTPEQIKLDAQNKALGSVYTPEGVNAGNALMNKFMQPGQLGRVSTDVPGAQQIGQRNQELLAKAGTSPDQAAAMANMKAGLGGYTSPEYQASREQMMRGQQSNFRTAQGQLAKAQARGKVYGAAGAAQQANLAASSEQAKGNLEQDLMVKNIDEQRSRNEAYGAYASGVQQQGFGQNLAATQNWNQDTSKLGEATLDREKLNLGQANAETASQIGLFTGAAGSALAERGGQRSADIQREGIRAINGGGVKQKAQKKALRR